MGEFLEVHGAPIAGTPDDIAAAVPGVGAAARIRNYARLAEALAQTKPGQVAKNWTKAEDITGPYNPFGYGLPISTGVPDKLFFNAPSIYRGAVNFINGENNPISPYNMELLRSQAHKRELMYKDPISFSNEAEQLLPNPGIYPYLSERMPQEYLRWRSEDNWDKMGK